VTGSLRRIANALALWGTVALAMLACDTGMMYHGCTKDKAYVTAMKSDLRNLVSAQEEYSAAHGRYASNAVLSINAMDGLFRESSGVRLRIETADSHGWSARTTHSQLTGASCSIDSIDREPKCDGSAARTRRTFSRNARQTYGNLSLDLWLFAFTIWRRQRRRRRESIVAATDPEALTEGQVAWR